MRSEEFLSLSGGLAADRVCPDVAGADAMFAVWSYGCAIGIGGGGVAWASLGGAMPLGLADKAL